MAFTKNTCKTLGLGAKSGPLEHPIWPSLHHNTSRQFCSQAFPNTDETETFKMAAFMPTIHLHRLQLQQPSVTDCVFSEKKNVEQLLPERLHIKEEPEMLSEGQEENSAACPVKCEDEEEKLQASQLHWRQLTEMNIKEEPSTWSLNEVTKKNRKICSKKKVHSFKCDVCSKCFTHIDSLQSHMRIHTREKPFKCDVCVENVVKKSLTRESTHKRFSNVMCKTKCMFFLKSFCVFSCIF
uniref:C2H2-type domain-containing protein n=1 Tax=Gouania willdenowi TaxID=441366 RepID=A0A8C5DUH6_GOUWI